MDELTPEQEAQVFNPKPETFCIKDRTYKIMPLTLGQVETLLMLSKIDLSKLAASGPAVIEQLASGIADILEEPDVQFIKKNLRFPMIKEIMQKVRKQTFLGIPEDKEVAKAGPGGQ